MRAMLKRFCDGPFGCFGYLDFYDPAGLHLARFATAEDDWLDNQVRISCIPAGTYRCTRTIFYRTGEQTFEITGVPGRSRILFHAGNTEEDVEGCVLLGEDFGSLQVRDEDSSRALVRLKWAVLRSKEAMQRFRTLTASVASFPLEVIWAAPGSWRTP